MSNPSRSILPVVPLRSLVVFPGSVTTLDVGGTAGAALAAEVLAGRAPRVLVATCQDHEDLLGAVAVEAEVKHAGKTRDGRSLITVHGRERRRVAALLQLEPFLTAEVEPVVEIPGEGEAFDVRVRAVREVAVELLQLADAPREVIVALESLDGPGALADRIAAQAGLSAADRRAILDELDVAARMTKVHAALQARVAELTRAAQEPADPRLREQVLREQLADIQEQLGETPADEDGLAARIAAAAMPPEAEQAARRAARRLRDLDPQSPEHTVTRTYLEWLVELPWSKRSPERAIDLAAARRMLDEDHQGLGKIKQRVVEYLAVRKLNPAKKAPILLLQGPPGVGKTSLGRSIARALGRELARVSLGGVRDEAEIRGHRRTYVGALPGRILQALRRVGTRNPVFVLDEIDKLGAGVHGDPSAALLEVLDPEQNATFSDHYIEVPFDLSEVVFIATANDLAPIPAALRDRMELLAIPGYTTAEKRAIARASLLPKQLAEHGLGPTQLALDGDALDAVIEGHTREAGVRSLERELAKIVRGVAVKVAAGDAAPSQIGAAELDDYLGPARFHAEVAERDPQPGVATGMAWTPSGGEILFVEATRMAGHGELVVTGQLGDVMKESAQTALSFVRANAAELGIAPGLLERSDVHLHVPAGAVPKDGPSAGNAIATALVSLLTDRPVVGDVAMTGEITLRGHVLPVGGIASKVLAAHRAGVRRVILPARNAKDLAEIPAEVRAELDIRLVSRLAETLALALPSMAVPANSNVPAPAERPALAA